MPDTQNKLQMNKREANEVWDRIFPLKVGDRVRVRKGHLKGKHYKMYTMAYGKTAIVVKIDAKFSFFPIVVKFLDPKVEQEANRVFAREELEYLESKESE